MTNEYTCVVCKVTYVKGWLDKDAMSEMRENFGEYKQEDCDIVCNDCYEEMFPYFPQMKEELKNG